MIKILIIEDNEDDYVLVREALSEGRFEIDWCASAKEAREFLSQDQHDLILLDHGLPDTNSLSFLDELRNRRRQVPIIVLTGRYDKALAVSVIKKGASNYLLKDEIFTHLLQTVRELLPASKINTNFLQLPSDDSARFVDTAEHIYRLLLEAMSEGCVVVGNEGVISFVNDAIGQLAGIDSHVLLGEHLVRFFDDDTRHALEAVLNSSSAANWVPTSLEGKILRQNSEPIPVLISIYHLEDDSIPYRGDWLFVLTDISQQVKAKQALTASFRLEQEQRSRLNALIESSRDGIILVGVDLNITVINSTALELLELPGDNTGWVGRPFAGLSHGKSGREDSFGKMLHAEFRRLNTGDSRPGKGSLNTKNHNINWLSLPVEQEGQSYGRMFLLQDVTEQNQLESMREMLTNTMVHDLRSPLATIHSSLEYVLELAGDEIKDTHRQMLEVAFRSSRTMLDLVSNILEVSRLESGEMPVTQMPLPVEYLLRTATEQIAPQAAAKNLKIHLEIQPSLPPAWTDQILVDRILQNLLDNAIKFSPPNSIIQVNLKSVLPESPDMPLEFIEVSICDYGMGIPAGSLEQIFQKFATGDTEQSGTGLGLAFCKLAVETLGGRIMAVNNPNGGARFSFTLPVAKVEV